MPSLTAQKTAPALWRSLDELAQNEDFKKHLVLEFPEPRSEDAGSMTRRRFLQLMGASMAMTALSGCTWEEEKIVPLSQQPSGRTVGVPQRFATYLELGGVAYPLLATSYQGRPIKMEGNDLHPCSLGASDVYTQAATLGLYDPDRSRGLVAYQNGVEKKRIEDGKEVEYTLEDFGGFIGPVMTALKAKGGEGLAFLCEATSSPSFERLKKKIQAAHPKATWHEWESVSRDNERAGSKIAFEKPLRTHYMMADAKVIAAFDCDFLCGHAASLKLSRDFSKSRKPEREGGMSRLYAFESRFSLTGAQADHRLPIRSEQVGPLLSELRYRVHKALGLGGIEQGPPKGFLGSEKVRVHLDALVADLVANKGKSVIAVGSSQPAEVHAAAHGLNAMLGNIGSTVRYTADAGDTPATPPGSIGGDRPSGAESLKALADALLAGKVSTLVIVGGNPVYTAPADLDFAAALAKAENSIHLSEYRDETSRRCTLHVNRAHGLECWGDARAWDTSLCLAQPLIAPIYNGISSIELLATLLGEEEKEGAKIVHTTYKSVVPGEDGGVAWRKALNDGFIASSQLPEVAPRGVPLSKLAPAEKERVYAEDDLEGGLEVTFHACSKIHDGRFANNGWLQELSEFMTKVSWDNVAVFAPDTAKELKVDNETIVTLKVGGREIDIVAYVMPGQARNSIALALGYGRVAAGQVGGLCNTTQDSYATTPIGVDVGRLRTLAGLDFSAGLEVVKSKRVFKLATTQNHHTIDKVGMEARGKRLKDIIRQADFEEWKEEPKFAQEVEGPALTSLFEEVDYSKRADAPEYDHKWGMAVDLSSCTGCGACEVACQSENNIPVVGKEQVLRAREMHWIRLDRYFQGPIDEPQVAIQPVMCQQCENAPCEQVCPVGATLHSKEGLNDQVYNRCVGTRYCSNNCPYKVRRFNFFNYHKTLEKPENEVIRFVFNPDVTVRSRGVMEKCTFCVQRIQTVKIRAKNERRPILDGEITTACAQACASEAIVFGDLNDKTSKVAKLHENDRSYGLLAELNTKPRLKYLAKIRNLHPDIAKAFPEIYGEREEKKKLEHAESHG